MVGGSRTKVREQAIAFKKKWLILLMQQFRTEIMSNVTINLPESVFSARRLSPEEFVRDMGIEPRYV